MMITLIATHSFPIPFENHHTGDVVIANLARSLEDLGHEVNLCAPKGPNSYQPNKGRFLEMRGSYGAYPPSAQECEQEAYNLYLDIFKQSDIVHDFSIGKTIVANLNNIGYKNTTCTLMGGPWTHSYPPRNLITWSASHRNRVLRGATDYENTPTPDLAGPPQFAVKEAKIVNGGIDTDYYSPLYDSDKKDFFLWMNRWHPAKGYKQAIEIAKVSGIELVLMGEHPDREKFDFQRQCALEAVELSKNLPNIKVGWLPPDPHHHDTKIQFYRQAKALLYTVQFNEPFGLSQAEALACGTPVIGTNYGSVSEVISHGETGFVCQNNTESFVNAISKINTISSINCRTEAVKRFDRLVMAKNYLGFYERVMAGDNW